MSSPRTGCAPARSFRGRRFTSWVNSFSTLRHLDITSRSSGIKQVELNQGDPSMKIPPWSGTVVGCIMIVQWGYFLFTGAVPELQTAPQEMTFHLAAEFITPFS